VIRTAIILSSITLFVTWYAHVINRTVDGSDVRRERFLKDLVYTATISGALFVLLVTWAMVGSCIWHVRGQSVGIVSVLGPPLLALIGFNLMAFAVGVALAELYCLADRQAFQRQTRRHVTRATTDAAPRDEQYYARERWWPASRERLMSDDAPAVVMPDHAASPVKIGPSAIGSSLNAAPHAQSTAR